MEGEGEGGREAQRARSEQIEREEGKRERGELAFRLKERKQISEIERNTSPGLHLFFYLYMKKYLDGSHQNQTLNRPPHNSKIKV